MNEDPRTILSNELQLLEIPEYVAGVIAMDAGSSQVVVDEYYLKTVIENGEDHDMKRALRVIGDFYSGALFEKFDD